MRALNVHQFQDYKKHKVEDVTPSPMRAGHVRIALKAAGVNFPDILIAEGKYQAQPPFPFIPGGEAAGIVSEVADDVKHLKVGDRVAYLGQVGAFATEVVAPVATVGPIGDMPFDIAAGLVLVYGTSYYALKQRAQLQPGETLVVLGAAGGVGLAAVELSKAMGARVIACASTDEKLEVCRAHGADETINYSGDMDLKKAIKALGGADVLYDPVGDKFAEPCVRAMNWGGRYLVVGFAAGDIPRIPLNLCLLKSIDIRGVFWGAWTQRDPKDHMNNIGEIMGMLKTGKIKPRISNHYPLDDFANAFDELTSRKAMGKVILTMD
ncbi:NADPH:quinone oxidoreductase [Litorimonas cladophorae]|uniref:NADPH:quinone oxidoreductase n=1 Tax=Litorimonas cladophorae TaxID=1220491 RepID=A0A918KH79_9PROT|nr:NADPH:quinone oxidoreductase family protein [Litorimonas cladophorae]GGX63379.1 NADPH:quinone oxidoreductase [Litorimonas cladophorae]